MYYCGSGRLIQVPYELQVRHLQTCPDMHFVGFLGSIGLVFI